MKYEITHGPVFAKLDLELDAGESIIAQPSSMLSMTTGFDVTARVGGQMGGTAVRKGFKSLLTGESLFAAVFTAKRDGQRLSLAPEALGEVFPLPMDGAAEFFIARGAFLACDPRIRIEMKYGGLRGWMAKTGLFLMQASGEGLLLVSSAGAVVSRTLDAEERLIIDNRYVIAFSTTVKYELVKVTDSIGHSLLSGEGLVNRYTGPGTVFYQTRPKPRNGGLLRDLASAIT